MFLARKAQRAAVAWTAALTSFTSVADIRLTPNDRTDESTILCTEHGAARVRVLAGNLTFPWSMAFLPNADMIITERPGRVRLFANGELLDQPVGTVSDIVNLLDVALAPSFAETGILFLSAIRPVNAGQRLEILQARVVSRSLVDLKTVFRADAAPPTPFSGGKLLFLPDGTLLVSTGDVNGASEAQNVLTDSGKILRLRENGTIPGDNPFRDSNHKASEIYTLGHRNVQGLALQRSTGRVWSVEHGPLGNDELNLLRPGGNFGWPIFAGTSLNDDARAVPSEQFDRPIYEWNSSIAPSAVLIYEGAGFPAWKGNLLITSLVGHSVHRLVLQDNAVTHEETILKGPDRIRTIGMGSNGALYLLTDSRNGKLLTLEPVANREGLCTL